MLTQARAVRPLRILLVEDSPTQAVLVQQAVKRTDCIEIIDTVEDGEQAIAFLRRQSVFANAERPDLILLDLNMPKKDGFQVLDAIKGDAALKTIPVIVFSTSDSDEDVAKSYALGASAYIAKPTGFGELQKVLANIGQYWSLAKFSNREHAA